MVDADKPVSLADDADLPTPAETAARLAALTAGGGVSRDYYGTGGAVEAFEEKIAAYLGKERAVLFPTGTLANLVGLRRLVAGMAGPGIGGVRLIVHRDSHLFNDMGDNLSLLAGLTMVPLASVDAGFAAAEVAAEVARAADARVAARIGAVAVESPSRRLQGRRFGAARMAEVTALARGRGIGTFLDGARMMIECAWSGDGAAAMAAPFDLVYLSLYKYLDAPFGCVLAGDAALFDGIHHDRRRFGGSLWEMWPAAVLAGASLDRQVGDWASARAHAEQVFARLEARGIAVHPWPDGTNVVPVALPAGRGGDAYEAALMRAGQARGLKLPPVVGGMLPVKINAGWLRRDPLALADALAAVGGEAARDA